MLILVLGAFGAEPRLLTYEEALAAALDNPTLRQAELRLEQSSTDIKTAWGGFDPALSISGGWNRSQSLQFQPPFPDPFKSVTDSYNVGTTLTAMAPTGTSGSVSGRLLSYHSEIEIADGTFVQEFYQPDFSFQLSQELLRGVRMAFNLQNVRQARERWTLQELEVERVRQQALADVARGYWSWVYAERAEEISAQSVHTAEEALRVGVARVDAGELAPVERTRLEAALVQARTDALASEQSVQQAEDGLLLLLGLPPGQDLTPGSAVGDPMALTLDAARAVEVALAQSLELQVARARVDAAQLALADARHATWPSLTASVEAGVRGGDADGWAQAFELLGGFPQVGVSGQFAVPLGGRVAHGQSERAAFEVAVLQSQVAEFERQVRAAVEQQVRVLVSARERVELADMNVRLAEQTLAAEDALSAAGRSILKDVLEARQAVDRARVEAIRARTDARAAEVELMRLQGQMGR